MRVSSDCVTFHPSGIDPSGRLFWFEGQVYRGVAAERAGFHRGLFDRGIIQRLVESKLLVETELTDLQVEGYPLVLKLRTIPFVSYAYEWCGATDAGRNSLVGTTVRDPKRLPQHLAADGHRAA